MMYTVNAKSNHLQTVLKALYHMPNATKPQVSQLTGLPGSTVHIVMTDLVKHGLVCDSGIAASSGGRRAATYQINGTFGMIAGVSLHANEVQVGVFDLLGKCLCSKAFPLSYAAMGPETYTAKIAGIITEMLSRQPDDNPRCIGIGVTIPGSVDPDSGVILQMSGAKLWQSFPLANRLSEALHLPVVVDKGVYASIHYLDHSGQMKHNRCSAYLSIGEAINSAVLIGGEVFRGTHNLAGEIGHMTVRRDGIPCYCGNTGCLELYCCDSGILKQYNAHVSKNITSIDEVVDLMLAGDRIATKIISQAIRYLVDAISTIFLTYDPDELIIQCSWLSKARSLYLGMLDSLYQKNMFTQRHAVDIQLLDGEPLQLQGAVAIAQSELLIKRCDELIENTF